VIVFVDSSALYAMLDISDANHQAARAGWIGLLHEQASLVTHNYVLLETSALLQNRLGVGALREHGIRAVFTFDSHFREQGFSLKP
jgi:uncharacterized protein